MAPSLRDGGERIVPGTWVQRKYGAPAVRDKTATRSADGAAVSEDAARGPRRAGAPKAGGARGRSIPGAAGAAEGLRRGPPRLR
ncbi:hypothetical protein GCM10023224_36550 [Streptomonospora halophila]|uniref:Uncharacterized protein n=1 Tax=Streptomonospora halophila TaxID=427369 RepID=A0ABP9GPE7_9ACTN